MDNYIGEIRVMAGFSQNLPPDGWLLCSGQTLNINDSQYQPLYSLIGTTWGGSGSTFALPNFNGRVVMGQGAGPGLTPRKLGQSFGAETVTPDASMIPSHNHTLTVSSGEGTSPDLTNSATLAKPTDGSMYYAFGGSTVPLSMLTLADKSIGNNTGVAQPHTNIMPGIGMYYIIAYQGLYPSRS